ncbi:MAG: carboxypeptidase regulatory-like domain-containing protein [Acidobacteriaceae bacterium]|nr:carboxypeptidase regulatory-like domain-containing protein [Acidobacteriaceae bacterium]MBV8569813.1 carboxypeptidase regulatory-like domain-containing protein [Acidobacteriaceae bacterium]
MQSKLNIILVFLLASVPACAADQCTVAGHVTNALTNDPVRKANLHLMPVGLQRSPADAAGQRGYVTVSNPDGSFRFTGVEPGSYQLSADRNGFLNGSYGPKRQRWSATTLVLKAGEEMTDLTFTLMPAGLITGRVVDADDDPVANASIQASRRVLVNGKMRYQPQAGVACDDRGEFRLAGLEPGRYLLSALAARGPSNEIPTGTLATAGPVTTYYPSALNAEDAVPLQVQSGREVGGIEIRLRSAQTFHIRGTVAQGNTGELSLNALPDGTNAMGGSSSGIGKDGKFEISNLSPGSYHLILFSHESTVVGSQVVRIDSADVNDVVLNVVPPGSLHGRARVEGTPPAGSPPWNPANVAVQLSPAVDGPHFGENGGFSISADGTFVISDVSAGTYNITAYDGVEETYLKAVRFNGEDVLGRPLDLSRGVSGELEIVFSYGSPEIYGTIPRSTGAAETNSGNSSPATVSVFAIRSDTGAVAGSNTTDIEGNFSIKSLAPGKYRLYALEDASGGEMESPDVVQALETKATEIEVKENENQQVQVTVISAEELHQVLARLGVEVQQ